MIPMWFGNLGGFNKLSCVQYKEAAVCCMSLSRWQTCIILQGNWFTGRYIWAEYTSGYYASGGDIISLVPQGADTVIYERLANRDNDLKRTTREHLEQFGAAGLRTLCLAYRDLSSDVYEGWNEKYIQAKSSLRDREKKLDEVCWSELLLCLSFILPIYCILVQTIIFCILLLEFCLYT